MSIIEQAIERDMAALMNRLHLQASEARKHAESTNNAMARDAAWRRHEAACEALNNVYWRDIDAIERDISQAVITEYEARKVLAM